MKKSIAILGSTGSIGQNTLKVAEHLSDSIRVVALSGHSNISLLKEQIEKFHPEIVAVTDETKVEELRSYNLPVRIVAGHEGVLEVASYPSVDFVVVAIVGMAALQPTLEAIEKGKSIGLANKEVLVAAGDLIAKKVQEKKSLLIPIDSEHSAIFQCLEGKKNEEISRLILTASGGPFRNYSIPQLETVTLEQALAHPTWKMGAKVTIDSSTLMNKGLEMIEARYLFQLPPEKIEVIIHPQSIIHSFVEFIDGCMFAELSEPHMIFPIQYALTYPERRNGLLPPYDFIKNPKLEFYPPDFNKFPALSFAGEAMKQGGSLPCFLNAANEILVHRFLNREISWQGILQRLDQLLHHHEVIKSDSLDVVFYVDREARERAMQA